MARVVLVAVGMIGVIARPARAADAPEPLLEEFFLAENANPQEKGKVQLTGVATRFWQEDDRVDQAVGHFEYGLTGRWQVQADVPYVWLRSAAAAGGEGETSRGWGDVELGTMLGVLLDPRRLALSVGAQVGLTTSDAAVRLEEKHEVEPFVVLARRLLNGELDLHFSSGVKSHPDREYDLGFVEPLGHWRVVLEGNRRDEEGAPATYYVTPGLAWKPRHSLEVGLGVPVRTGSGPHRTRVILQATAEF
jgi:hypothetical protein